MALAFVQSNSAMADPEGTPLTVALTGVGAGNLVVLWIKHEGTSTTVTASDGTSSFTSGTSVSHGNGDLHGRWMYLLVGNSGTRTYTVTLGAQRPYKRIHVWEFSYTGTLSLDVQNIGSGTSAAPASGTVTTTGTDAVALGGYGEYGSGTLSSPLINGVAAGGSRINSPAGSFAGSWYGLLTATFTGGTASATLSGSAEWLCNILVLKASGGATTSWPLSARYHQNNLVALG